MRPRPRRAGGIRRCTGSSETPPTPARSAGATSCSMVSTSRLSTRSPSSARRRSCASAARTSPAGAATPPSSCSQASSAAAHAARPTSACPLAATADATSTTPAAAARSTAPRPAATSASRARSSNARSSSSLPRSTATVTSSQRHSRRPRGKQNGPGPRSEQRLASIGAEITRAEQALERYHEAFEQRKLSPDRCEERLSRLQARLEDLRGQQAELAPSTRDEAGHGRRRSRSRSRRRPTRTRHRRRRAAEGEGAPPAADPGATRRRTSADSAHLQARHARGLRNVRKSGACRDRTGDLRLAKPVLSQLS
jgi:hypothetical protein